jgi:starch phosphorylase
MRWFESERSSDRTWFARTYPELRHRPIAYFCAEFGIYHSVPIYSGGLGVLAGDHCKTASDLGVPLVGVGILYRDGYFD